MMWFKKKKVFCGNCVFHYGGEKCITDKKITPIREENILGNCLELNKNNDCKRYTNRLWYGYD